MKESVPIPLLLCFGLLAETGGSFGDVLSPVTQLGALGLLTIYLFWAVRERREEREARSVDGEAERSARLEEIKAITGAHKEQLSQTIEALHRAYESRRPE